MKTNEDTRGAAALRSADASTASAAGRALGSITTPRKAAAGRATLDKHRNLIGPPPKDPLSLPCTCGAGTATEIGDHHKTTCPRGRLLYQRAKIAAKKATQEGANHASD